MVSASSSSSHLSSTMRVAFLLSIVALSLAVCLLSGSEAVSGQAPNPPPIWPAQFLARFGLYMFDVPSESPIFNETSFFSYNIDIDSQLIEYPTRCVPVFPGGDKSPCNILFLEAGIYWNQPQLGVDCCQLFAGVGPTPRNFTRGFNWNGTAQAPNYYGDYFETDFYLSEDQTFKYWTQLVSPPTSHHDIFFRDGSGAFWAWDHLNVTSVPASTFDLFADPATCATSCQAALGLSDEEHADALGKAKRSGMIQLAMHHHQLEQREAAEAAAARSHSKRPHATPKKPHHEAHPKKLVE